MAKGSGALNPYLQACGSQLGVHVIWEVLRPECGVCQIA